MKKDFYSPYFIVPKKDSGLRPILDLHFPNQDLHRLPDQDVGAEARSDMYSLIGWVYCDIPVG